MRNMQSGNLDVPTAGLSLRQLRTMAVGSPSPTNLPRPELSRR